MADKHRRHTNLREEYLEKLTAQFGKITVLVAGKPRRGKSTALNNLFGGNLKARGGVASVTRAVIESTSRRHGVEVRFIDSPGLAATDEVNTQKAVKDMIKMAGSDNFTLLYCLSAVDGIDESDNTTMRELTRRFGRDVWKRCVLVLTYCDTAREQNFKTADSDEAYKRYLSQYVKGFKVALGKHIPKVPPVQLVFDCQTGDISPETIVAVPVARTRDAGMEANIIPGLKTGKNVHWPEYAFLEIVRKSRRFSVADIKKKYGIAVAVGGATIGAGVGAAVGAAAGGPVGAVLGAGIGALIGGLGGLAVSK